MEQLATERKVEAAALQTTPLMTNGNAVHSQDGYTSDEQSLMTYSEQTPYPIDNDGTYASM